MGLYCLLILLVINFKSEKTLEHINRTHYHELNLLLWDMHQKFIEPELAFELYERRWGYVNQDKLVEKEKQLIEKLINEFGNGFFMPCE